MKKLIDAYRRMYMRLLGTEMHFYDKLMKWGLIDLRTNFKLTGKAFLKLMKLYDKRLQAGAVTMPKEVEQKFQELDALLDE